MWDHLGMELYFILDASSNVGKSNFESAKIFAIEMVREVSNKFPIYFAKVCTFTLRDLGGGGGGLETETAKTYQLQI